LNRFARRTPYELTQGTENEADRRLASVLLVLFIPSAGFMLLLFLCASSLAVALLLSSDEQLASLTRSSVWAEFFARPAELHITADDLIGAFRLAGLEAADPTAMAPDDYGLTPFVCEGTRFLIPSLGEESGGRIFICERPEDLDLLARHYNQASRMTALFFSWVFVRDRVLLQINGSLAENVARRYEQALSFLPALPMSLAPTASPAQPTDLPFPMKDFLPFPELPATPTLPAPLPPMTMAAAPEPPLSTAHTTANLHAQPDPASTVIAVVPPGQSMRVVGQDFLGQWLQLGSGYWIAATAVGSIPVGLPVTAQPAPAPTAAAGPVANSMSTVYERPDLAAATVGSMQPGHPLAVVGQDSSGQWLQLASGLWIVAATVDGIPAGLPVTAQPTPVPAAAGPVANSTSTVYEGPDLAAAAVGSMQPGHPLAVVGQDSSGQWLQVDGTPAGLPVTAQPMPTLAPPVSEPQAGLSVQLVIVVNNRSDEILEIRNTSAASLDISGWQLNGSKGNESCTVPDGVVLAPGNGYQVATGDSQPQGNGIKCNEKPIWNNDEETIYLFRPSGLILSIESVQQ